MAHYIALKTIKTCTGETVLKEGDILKPVHRHFDCFGVDQRNKFWTDDFLDSQPRTFRRINE